ncbi:MAG TPA: hypothetical protein VMH02_01850 [Verrucomicrobiae bacterium]|nr:hypothetical protein [Verrucomicrobiae bacterium]
MRAAAALAVAALLATIAPARSQGGDLTTAAQILQGIAQSQNGLRSYRVPLTMSGHVKVKFISVPFSMSGTQYFEAPDRQALHMDDVPGIAKSFATTVSNIGTPQTWPQTYTIVLQGRRQHDHHNAYVLVGTPKKAGNVKSVTMLVNPESFAIEDVFFAYQNGSKLEIAPAHHDKNPYHLPESMTVTADFPGYSGNAVIAYGAYETNVAIPDAVFRQ